MWIEFTGQGLEALEKRCEKKEQHMAALGARMLSPEKRAAEAQGTVEMRVGHETAMLADIAHNVSRGMTMVLGWLRDWSGATGNVSVAVNTDYVVTTLSAQEVTALVAAWQMGAISKNTLFWNLQQGEVIEDGLSFEEEEARIGDTPPALQSDPMQVEEPTAQPAQPAQPAAPAVDFAPMVEALEGLRTEPAQPVDLTPVLTMLASAVEAIKNQPAPAITINQEAPPAPTITMPAITMPPITVNVDKNGTIVFEEDGEGNITGARMS
jgi:hypothetical protein